VPLVVNSAAAFLTIVAARRAKPVPGENRRRQQAKWQGDNGPLQPRGQSEIFGCALSRSRAAVVPQAVVRCCQSAGPVPIIVCLIMSPGLTTSPVCSQFHDLAPSGIDIFTVCFVVTFRQITFPFVTLMPVSEPPTPTRGVVKTCNVPPQSASPVPGLQPLSCPQAVQSPKVRHQTEGERRSTPGNRS